MESAIQEIRPDFKVDFNHQDEITRLMRRQFLQQLRENLTDCGKYSICLVQPYSTAIKSKKNSRNE